MTVLCSVWEEFCCQQTGDEHQAGTDRHTEFSPSIGPNTVLSSLAIRKTTEKSTSSGKLPAGISCPND